MALPASLSPISRPRRWGVWFGLLLLLADLLASGLAPPRAAMAGNPLFAQDATGDRIVVCTAGGLVVIDRATGQPVTPDADTTAQRDFCVFCLPCMQGGFALPSSAAPALPVVQRIIPPRPRATATTPPHRPTGDAWPRGPPARRWT